MRTGREFHSSSAGASPRPNAARTLVVTDSAPGSSKTAVTKARRSCAGCGPYSVAISNQAAVAAAVATASGIRASGKYALSL